MSHKKEIEPIGWTIVALFLFLSLYLNILQTPTTSAATSESTMKESLVTEGEIRYTPMCSDDCMLPIVFNLTNGISFDKRQFGGYVRELRKGKLLELTSWIGESYTYLSNETIGYAKICKPFIDTNGTFREGCVEVPQYGLVNRTGWTLFPISDYAKALEKDRNYIFVLKGKIAPDTWVDVVPTIDGYSLTKYANWSHTPSDYAFYDFGELRNDSFDAATFNTNIVEAGPWGPRGPQKKPWYISSATIPDGSSYGNTTIVGNKNSTRDEARMPIDLGWFTTPNAAFTVQCSHFANSTSATNRFEMFGIRTGEGGGGTGIQYAIGIFGIALGGPSDTNYSFYAQDSACSAGSGTLWGPLNNNVWENFTIYYNYTDNATRFYINNRLVWNFTKCWTGAHWNVTFDLESTGNLANFWDSCAMWDGAPDDRPTSGAPPGDTCTCPSPQTAWEVDLVDNCTVSTPCDIPDYALSFIGSGMFNISSRLNVSTLNNITTAGRFYIYPTGAVKING